MNEEKLLAAVGKKNFQNYFTFAVNALHGGKPGPTDQFLKDNLESIKETSEYLYGDMKFGNLYRGIILREKQKYLKPHKNFTYLSTSKNRLVAKNFADPTASGFGSLFSLGDYGYLIKIEEPYFVLFHYDILDKFKRLFSNNFRPEDIKLLKEQKEVTILQPDRELKLISYKTKKNPIKTKKNPIKTISPGWLFDEYEYTDEELEAMRDETTPDVYEPSFPAIDNPEQLGVATYHFISEANSWLKNMLSRFEHDGIDPEYNDLMKFGYAVQQFFFHILSPFYSSNQTFRSKFLYGYIRALEKDGYFADSARDVSHNFRIELYKMAKYADLFSTLKVPNITDGMRRSDWLSLYEKTRDMRNKFLWDWRQTNITTYDKKIKTLGKRLLRSEFVLDERFHNFDKIWKKEIIDVGDKEFVPYWVGRKKARKKKKRRRR